MSDILPKTPDPEIDKEKFIDWKAVAINQEKIRISVENQKRRFKIFNIVCICISIVLLILVVILLRYCRQNINEQKEYILSEHDKLMENGVTIADNGLVYFVAKVKRTVIGPDYMTKNLKSGNNCTMYIVDYDGHVFSIDFDPELLLLTDGSYIKVYYKLKYVDEVHIKLSDYEIYGNLENEYYLNMEVNGNE